MFELPDDAFAQASKGPNAKADGGSERRIDRAHEKRADHARPLQPPTDNARPEGVQVELYVRQLRHGLSQSVAGRADDSNAPHGGVELARREPAYQALMSDAQPKARGLASSRRSARAAAGAAGLHAPVRR